MYVLKDTRCIFAHKGIKIKLIPYVGVLVGFVGVDGV